MPRCCCEDESHELLLDEGANVTTCQTRDDISTMDKAVLTFVHECHALRGRVSFGEIQRALKLPNQQHAVYYVRKLERAGLLKTTGARGRRIKPVNVQAS